MNKYLKALIVALCAVVLVVGSVAATVAYLTATTADVEHTFTAGNINIALNDPDDIDEKMVPGEDIEADRVVTVLANSEKCYLFVKVNKLNNFDTYLTYTRADGWTELASNVTDANGVYDVFYRVVDANKTENQDFDVFAKFTAKASCTKAMYDAINPDAKPKVTLTAYAVQHAGMDEDVAKAWRVAQGLEQGTDPQPNE